MDSKDLILRGAVDVIQQTELQERLNSGEKLRIKFGIDPTAGRIHIGRAATIRHLKHFQDLGHEIHVIIGSFTAQIGDSSDKEVERPALSKAEVEKNMADYEKQLSYIFDTSKMTVHYNGDWFDKMDLSEFMKLQQIFSVAQMIERDNFSIRYKNGDRIGLHEFSYALLQGYDSVAMKADVEIGGTDQLFNLLAGRTIQKNYNQKPQNIITYELLLGLDGRKMSTSWGNCIYVDDEANEMYGKIMSLKDDLMWDYFRIVTELESSELASIKQQLDSNEDPRGLKARLAHEITKMYHDEAAADRATEAFDNQFVDKSLPTDIEEKSVELGERNVIELLSETGLVDSNSEARRMLKQGGVKLNQEKITSEVLTISDGDVLQVGKRRFIRIKG